MTGLFAILVVAMGLIAATGRRWTRPLFIAAAAASLVQSVVGVHPGATLTFAWWPDLGLDFAWAVNAYNLPLLWLNGVVLLATAWTDRSAGRGQPLLLLFAAVGVTVSFLSENFLLFFLGFEMAVLPFFILVRRYGGDGRREAGFYFLGFSALAGIALLAGILWLLGFGLTSAASVRALTPTAQIIGYGLLLITWAVKTPLWPFHLWLPRTHGEASTPVSMYLAGVALKVAPYGLILIGSHLPAAVRVYHPGLAAWGAVNILLGAVLALAQTDLKQTVALSSISSMGYVMLALAPGTRLGYEVAVLVMVGHGLVSPLLFWVSNRVAGITGTRSLDGLTGLFHVSPGLARWLTLGALSYMGIPGLALFPGELGVLAAAWPTTRWVLVLVLPGILVTAAVWLRILARARFGPPPPAFAEPPADRVGAWWLAAPLLAFGMAPAWWVGLWHWGGIGR